MTSSLTLSLISAVCIFGGVLLGLVLRGLLPEQHLRDESKDTVKLGAGMIATVSALVLGLLVASAKNAFDTTEEEITQRGAKIMFLDRLLADYGPETKETREKLRNTVAASIEMIWPDEKKGDSGSTDYEQMNGMQVTQMTLFKVTPTTDAQRQLYGTAQQLLTDLRQSRWVLIERGQHAIPIPFLVVLLFWLTVLHVSFGLFAPRNGTVITALLISALSVSGAIFIVLDMTHPLHESPIIRAEEPKASTMPSKTFTFHGTKLLTLLLLLNVFAALGRDRAFPVDRTKPATYAPAAAYV